MKYCWYIAGLQLVKIFYSLGFILLKKFGMYSKEPEYRGFLLGLILEVAGRMEQEAMPNVLERSLSLSSISMSYIFCGRETVVVFQNTSPGNK